MAMAVIITKLILKRMVFFYASSHKSMPKRAFVM